MSAQELQRHRCLQGRMSVSRRSDKHTTHSLLLSLFSSSDGCAKRAKPLSRGTGAGFLVVYSGRVRDVHRYLGFLVVFVLDPINLL